MECKMKKMVDIAELGRKMMLYSAKIDDDAEFNNWCRLAPKLIGMGTATHPKGMDELTEQELATANQAFIILVSQGEIVIK
jgi:hypothetical protein